MLSTSPTAGIVPNSIQGKLNVDSTTENLNISVKALTCNENTSAIADHVKATGHNIIWDDFDNLAPGKTD